MTVPRMIVTVPQQAVTSGAFATIRISLDTDDAILAAAVVSAVLPTHTFADVTVTDLAFSGPGSSGLSVNGPLGADGALTLAGVRTAGVAGVVPVAELRVKVIGPAGAALPLVVSVLDATALDGRALIFETATVFVGVEIGPLTVVTTAPPSGRVGEPYHTVLRATGARGVNLWQAASPFPVGLILEKSGVLHGTPNRAGVTTVSVLVSDSLSALSTTASITVTIGASRLRIDQPPLPPVTPGRPYAFNLRSVGGRPPVTWTSPNLPAGMHLDNGAITGTLTAFPPDLQPFQVALQVQDSDTPPQVDRDTFTLPIQLLSPAQTISLSRPTAVAVGRDLLLAEYDMALSATLFAPARDVEAQREFDDIKASILDELFGTYMGFNTSTGAPTGPGNHQFSPDGGGGWQGGEPPPGWNDRPGSTPQNDFAAERERQQRLIGEYKLIDELSQTGAPVHIDVCVFVDGDEVLCTTAGDPRNNLRAMRRPSPSGLSGGASSGIQQAGWLARAAVTLTGDRLFSSARKDFGMWLTQQRSSASKTGASVIRDTVPEDALKLDSARLVNTRIGRLAMQRELATRSTSYLLGIGGLLIIGALAGGLAGALFILLPIAGLFGSGFLQAQNTLRAAGAELIDIAAMLDVAWDLPKTSGTDREKVLQLTTGPHVVRVEWQAQIEQRSNLSVQQWTNAASTGVSFGVTFTPRNPLHWQRLDGSLTVAVTGVVGSGGQDFPVSLTRSDVDVLVAAEDGNLYLAAGKGDGTFADPAVFYEQHGGNNAKLKIRPLDHIGRSSVIARDTDGVAFRLNDGIRGFKGISVVIDGPIFDFEAADFDGDGWQEMLVAVEGRFGILKTLKTYFTANIQSQMTWIDAEAPVRRDALPAILASNALAPVWDRTSSTGFAHVAIVERISGQAAIFRNLSNWLFETPSLLEGLDSKDTTRQPVSMVYGDFAHGDHRLAVACRQAQRVDIYAHAGARFRLSQSVKLPLRPEQIVQGPASSGGLVGVSQDGRTIFAIYWPSPDVQPHIQPVYHVEGKKQIASGEGIVAITDFFANKVMIYK